MNQLQDFEAHINSKWQDAMTSDEVQQLMKDLPSLDKRLVAIYMTQVYHYAVHTPRHQALVGVNPNNSDIKYMQYCFEHALEETGHELMAVKDLQSLGYNLDTQNLPALLPSTDLLIAFLYNEARSSSPIHHLGYGFWSENACPFIDEFMKGLMSHFGLEKTQLTFYSSHVTIDEGHAQEVRKIISQVAHTDEDWRGMRRVADISFDLTFGIVKETIDAYRNLVFGESDQFRAFLA